MRRDSKLQPPDYWLLGSALALVTIGLLLVFDASYAKAADLRSMNYDPYYLLKRQSVFVLAGLLCLWAASHIPFKTLRNLGILAAGLALLLLGGVLVAGHAAHGARSWFLIGPFSVQPSEFAKVALVLYLAGALSSWRTFAKGGPKRWAVPAVVCLMIVGLVVAERDLGTAVLLCVVSAFMFYSAGARKRYLILVGLVGALAVAGAMTHIPHCQARWRAFTDPWTYRFDEGYQTVHSLVGISSGGVTGVGLCEGRVKFYMPAASTDYIFATLVEETGLIGGIGLLVGFGILTYRGLHIAHRSKSVYGCLLASGLVSVIGVQFLINVAVVSAAIPATGLSLPFVSYGGSGMVAMLVCVGLLLSASRQTDTVMERRDLDEDSIGRRRNGGAHVSRNKRRSSFEGVRPSGRAAIHR